MYRLRDHPWRGEVLPYAVALDEGEAREALGARTDAQFARALGLLRERGVLRPDADRDKVWVTYLGRPRRRMYLFALPDAVAVRRAARAALWDERHGTGPETRWADALRR